ncbi:MAG TPA: hypothetical protein VJ904_13190, partial [Tichowtungia sp.]|nr:hypothetical protein [Tichowtungia sp.]
MKKMSCESRSEYISVQKRRYRRAGKTYKTRLLDEVCEVCNYERKYAVKLLNGTRRPSKGKRGRKSEYNDPELIKALKTCWLRSGLMCGKRLKQALPLWLKHYEKHYGALSEQCRKKLLKIRAGVLHGVDVLPLDFMSYSSFPTYCKMLSSTIFSSANLSMSA